VEQSVVYEVPPVPHTSGYAPASSGELQMPIPLAWMQYRHPCGAVVHALQLLRYCWHGSQSLMRPSPPNTSKQARTQASESASWTPTKEENKSAIECLEKENNLQFYHTHTPNSLEAMPGRILH
jgi:hypothetical protein